MTISECIQLLQLPQSFSQKQLKAAYRKMTLKYHPDRNNGNDDMFLKIQKAYDILEIHLKKPKPSSRPKSNPRYNQQNTQWYKQQQAEKAYKEEMRKRQFYENYYIEKEKQYNSQFLSNVKWGCSVTTLVVLGCIAIGVLFPPRKPTKKYKPESDIVKVNDFKNTSLSLKIDSLNELYSRLDFPPRYPGGEDALYEHFHFFTSYPKSSIENETEGKVYASIIVNSDSTISNIDILASPDEILGTEVINVLKLIKKFYPAIKNDTPIQAEYIIPVSFKLE